MASSKSSASYDTLISLYNKLTCLNGMITPDAVDRLEDELSKIFTVTKTHHYKQGQKYGHLAGAIPKPKYRLVIGNVTWTYTIPANPGAHSMAALAVRNAATLPKQYVADHKILMKSNNDYLGIKEVGKDLIPYAAGNKALAPLKKQYIGFGDLTVLLMINHLHQKTAIKMTTAQKHKYKATGYNIPWDPTTSITVYFMQLDRFQVSIGSCGIATSNAEKTMAAGAQMWWNKMLTEDQIVAWRTMQPHSRHGPSSRLTSPRNGWIASNTLP
jgi:hypothetical protein